MRRRRSRKMRRSLVRRLRRLGGSLRCGGYVRGGGGLGGGGGLRGGGGPGDGGGPSGRRRWWVMYGEGGGVRGKVVGVVGEVAANVRVQGKGVDECVRRL